MSSEPLAHEPVVEIGQVRELARDLVVIPNHGVELVPNIGVIGGNHSVLVVETGIGPRNAEKVPAFATEYAKGRKLRDFAAGLRGTPAGANETLVRPCSPDEAS